MASISADTPDLEAQKTQEARHNSLAFKSTTSNYYSPLPNFQLVQSPVELMILSQLDLPGMDAFSNNESDKKNSLFR